MNNAIDDGDVGRAKRGPQVVTNLGKCELYAEETKEKWTESEVGCPATLYCSL